MGRWMRNLGEWGGGIGVCVFARCEGGVLGREEFALDTVHVDKCVLGEGYFGGRQVQ